VPAIVVNKMKETTAGPGQFPAMLKGIYWDGSSRSSKGVFKESGGEWGRDSNGTDLVALYDEPIASSDPRDQAANPPFIYPICSGNQGAIHNQITSFRGRWHTHCSGQLGVKTGGYYNNGHYYGGQFWWMGFEQLPSNSFLDPNHYDHGIRLMNAVVASRINKIYFYDELGYVIGGDNSALSFSSFKAMHP
jgi:hypothetical protein